MVDPTGLYGKLKIVKVYRVPSYLLKSLKRGDWYKFKKGFERVVTNTQWLDSVINFQENKVLTYITSQKLIIEEQLALDTTSKHISNILFGERLLTYKSVHLSDHFAISDTFTVNEPTSIDYYSNPLPEKLVLKDIFHTTIEKINIEALEFNQRYLIKKE